MLPEDLKRRAQALARRRGVSFGELVRGSLEATLRGDAGEVAEDTLFSDSAVYDGAVPEDLSERHDRYLYDGEPGGESG